MVTGSAGTTVLIPVHAIHRDGRLWPEPERFDPERFLAGVGSASEQPARGAAKPTALSTAGHRHPRGAYLPFGAGRRMCVGAGFALLEATIIMAAVGRRYRLAVDEDADVVPEATVTLRPRGGLPMRVHRR